MSQKEKIREWLIQGHRINQMDALGWFGCMRLGARILELRKEGLSISAEMKSVAGKKFTSYRLV